MKREVICPKCKGEESPNSVEYIGGGKHKCFECQTEFKREVTDGPVRVGMRISSDTNKWLDNKSYELGMTKSALLTMAVENFRKESDAMTYIPTMLSKLEQEE